MVERPDGLWLEGVYGTTASGLSAWVGSVDLDGVEQWRKELAPCGTEVPTQFLDAAKSDNGVWGILRVETGTGPVDYEDLVVRLDWQGDIAEAYRIEIPNSSVHWGTLDLAVAGDAVVIGGVASDDFNAPKTHWVARVL